MYVCVCLEVQRAKILSSSVRIQIQWSNYKRKNARVVTKLTFSMKGQALGITLETQDASNVHF